MDTILKIIAENGVTLLEIIGAAVLLATLITSLTPTKKDDAVVSKLRKVLEALSLLKPKLELPETDSKEAE